MAVPSLQSALNAGEISPELYGQVDLKKLASAATTMRNCVASYKGGCFSRAGLAFVGRCLQDGSLFPPRPIPFQFSLSQGIILEFGDQYIRFVFRGGYVLENPVAITGATRANPCVISVSGTPFANGDWVFILGVGGMTQLNGNTYIVASAGAGSFALNDLNGNPVNSAAFGTYTSGGTVSRLYTIASPYASIDLPYLKFSQSADVMSLTCSNPDTQTEYPPYDLQRLGAIDWTITQANFDPVILPPASVQASANRQAPSGGINATFAYQITAVDRKGNESLASQTATCNGADLVVEGGTNTISWLYVNGATTYNVYRAPASTNTSGKPNPVPAGSIFGYAGSAFGTQFLDNASVVDLTQTPPLHQDPLAPGQILAVNITNGGSGLTSVNYTINTLTGTGFAGYPVIVGGSLGAFVITNPGKNYQPGDSIAFNGSGFASGAVTYGGNPSGGDTITLNGVVWTFVTALTTGNQVLIGGALVDTLTALVADLSASSNAALTVASYSINSAQTALLVNYKTAGTVGNSYTLASSGSGTPSGATLTGGSVSSGGYASGTYTFTHGNPTNGQTIILDGVTWTFVLGFPVGNQTQIQGTLANTLLALKNGLNASGNASINLANYNASATVLGITYKTSGPAGNSYALGAGSYAGTISGGTLTGGSSGATDPAATLDVGPTTGTWPGVAAYFQQRRFYANSFNNPDTFWASQTGLFANYDASIPTQPTDSITASPWTEQVNGIQWLIPMPGGLIAMTGKRAWQIVGEGSYQLNVQPITPSSTQAQPQAFNGSSPTVPPIVNDYEVFYVQAIGSTTVRALSWNLLTNIYTGADLTILSSHLFLQHRIIQWAFAREPYKIFWAVREDGTLLSLTYLKDQEVYGWARHDTQGLVVGVATVTEPPVDAIYCVVKRFPSYAPQGVYIMERMDDRLWQTVEDAYAVDSGVSNPMPSPASDLFASSLTGTVTFTAPVPVFDATAPNKIIRMGGGIARVNTFTDANHVNATWLLSPSASQLSGPYAPAGEWTIAAVTASLSISHLAGMSVVALLDGVPVTGLTVAANGILTLPFGASDAKAGLGYTAQFQTPYINSGNPTDQGRLKVLPAATLRLASSSGFQLGSNQPDGAAQNPPQLAPIWSDLATADMADQGAKTYNSPSGRPVTQLYTGDIRVVVKSGWAKPGQIAAQQTLPLSFEVIAVMPESLEGGLPEAGYSPKDQGGGQGQRTKVGGGALRI